MSEPPLQPAPSPAGPSGQPVAASFRRTRSAVAGIASAGDELTLSGMVITLVRGWWIVALVTLLALLATTALLKTSQPRFAAGMTVAPAELDLSVTYGLVQDLEQFANLATLAQRPTKLEQISTMERYERMIGSPQLAEQLQAEPGVMQVIFRADWDQESGSWRQPPGLLNDLYYGSLSFFAFPGWSAPDANGLVRHLRQRLSVFKLQGTALRQMGYVHTNPEFAVALLEKVHAIADDLLRDDARQRAAAQIAQLEQTLADPSLAPARRTALDTILAQHYQTEALLAADVPYAAEVLTAATASPEPVSANPILVLALAAVMGAILGIFAVFLRAALRN